MRVLPCVALLLAACAVPSAAEFHPGQLVTRIAVGQGMGSGTPVWTNLKGETAFLTAKHVVEADTGAPRILWDAKEYPAVRVEKHPDMDVALVWVAASFRTVPISREPLRFGDRVQGAGFLFGRYLSVDDGLISTPGTASLDMFPGSSGGPILRNGAIVGVISACLAVNSPFGSIPLGASTDFVPVSDAWPWLDAMLGT